MRVTGVERQHMSALPDDLEVQPWVCCGRHQLGHWFGRCGFFGCGEGFDTARTRSSPERYLISATTAFWASSACAAGDAC
jgi:hypothetical protein